MSSFVPFFLDGRVISIQKYDNENAISFSRRASFILSFSTDEDNYQSAVFYSKYHANMIEFGAVYDEFITKEVERLREIALKRQKRELNI